MVFKPWQRTCGVVWGSLRIRENRILEPLTIQMKSLAEKCELKKSQCSKILASLAEIGAEGLKAGKFTLPGLVNIKLRNKPATKACKKEIFGKMQIVKARPARTVVKAFPVSAIKKLF